MESARLGLARVEATVGAMQEIRGRVELIAEQMLTLAEQTQQVGEITATVDDLADQSNLLAVNAAIEANEPCPMVTGPDQGRGQGPRLPGASERGSGAEGLLIIRQSVLTPTCVRGVTADLIVVLDAERLLTDPRLAVHEETR